MVDTAPATAVYVSNAGDAEIQILAVNPETGRFECDDGLSDRPAIGRADRS